MATQRDHARVASAVRRFALAQERWDQEREHYAQALARGQEAGLTVRQLAEATGLTFSRVAQIIRGARGEGPGR